MTRTFGLETSPGCPDRRVSPHNGSNSNGWDLEGSAASIAGLRMNDAAGCPLSRSRPVDSTRNRWPFDSGETRAGS
jgi:hypothetical protein